MKVQVELNYDIDSIATQIYEAAQKKAKDLLIDEMAVTIAKRVLARSDYQKKIETLSWKYMNDLFHNTLKKYESTRGYGWIVDDDTANEISQSVEKKLNDLGPERIADALISQELFSRLIPYQLRNGTVKTPSEAIDIFTAAVARRLTMSKTAREMFIEILRSESEVTNE